MQNDREKRQTQYGILQSDNDLNIAQEEGTVYGTAPALVSDEPEYNPIPAPKEITEEDKIKQGLMNMPRDLGIYNPSGRNMIIGSVLQKPDGKIQFEFVLDDGESVTKQSFEEHFKRNGIPFSSTPTGSVITVDPNSISNLAQLEKAKEGIGAEMKIFHRELYPKEANKIVEPVSKPIADAAGLANEEKNRQQSLERANQEFAKEKSFADALKERITLRNIAIALAVAVAAAAVVAACVFAFPAVAAVAGTAMAAVGISGASTAVIAGTCAGVAAGTTLGVIAFQNVSGAVGTTLGSSIKTPEHNANLLEEKFPQTNDFLKQINGVEDGKNRNREFDKDLKNWG